jgi:hypothetical protein
MDGAARIAARLKTYTFTIFSSEGSLGMTGSKLDYAVRGLS